MNKEVFIGPISINTKGVGFFDREPEKKDRENSVEIQPENINRAFHGDIVEIELTGEKIKNREQGKVIKIITRASDEFVGTVSRTVLDTGEEKVFVVPDDKRLYVDIFLSAIHQSVGEVSEDDKVLVKIKKWDTLEGEVIKVIGKAGENNTEMEAIVLEKGFRIEFPAEVEREAEKIRGAYKATATTEIAKRRDMRNVTTMTIDPFDAKDFDDAISFVDLGNNTFEIGVHIADVSYFVTPNTPLDHESEKRGLSVYLVDRTIPMLPEILSNDLCSLNANEDKFTFSAVFTMDDGGKVSDKWFGKTVIHSDKRFTYEEAQDILDKKTGLHFNELDTLNKIAKVLQKKKFENGAIEFETDEIKFELDPDGKPIRVFRKVRKDIHKLVEEFMLLANQEVATYMNKETGAKELKTPFIYRIHDVPDKDKIANLKIFLKSLGYDLKSSHGEITATEINRLLKEVTGKPEESLVKTT